MGIFTQSRVSAVYRYSTPIVDVVRRPGWGSTFTCVFSLLCSELRGLGYSREGLSRRSASGIVLRSNEIYRELKVKRDRRVTVCMPLLNKALHPVSL